MMAGRDIAKVLEGVDIEKVLQRVVDKFNDNISMHSSQSYVNSHSPYCSIQDHAQCRIGQSSIRWRRVLEWGLAVFTKYSGSAAWEYYEPTHYAT